MGFFCFFQGTLCTTARVIGRNKFDRSVAYLRKNIKICLFGPNGLCDCAQDALGAMGLERRQGETSFRASVFDADAQDVTILFQEQPERRYFLQGRGIRMKTSANETFLARMASSTWTKHGSSNFFCEESTRVSAEKVTTSRREFWMGNFSQPTLRTKFLSRVPR